MTITPEARPYLDTLRRIPADVRLSMATRELHVSSRSSCVCGWAIREAVARTTERDAGDVPRDDPAVPVDFSSASTMKKLYGGSYEEWDDIYWLSTDYSASSSYIEEAFLIAVAEAAEGRRLV